MEDRLAIYMLIASHPPSADTAFADYTRSVYLDDGVFDRGPTLEGARGVDAIAGFTLKLEHVGPSSNVEVLRVDPDHGNVLKAFDAMGRPAWPSREQIVELRKAGSMAPAEHLKLKNGELHLTVPAHGLAVVIVGK